MSEKKLLPFWKLSRWPGNFPDGLETFQMVSKVSRWSGDFPDGLETFQMARKLSRWSGNFPNGLETFQMVWKLSRWSKNFPDGLETFQMVWKLSRWSGNILMDMSRKRFTHFMTQLLKKRFTHSVRKVFARKSLPPRKFWLFRSLPDSGYSLRIFCGYSGDILRIFSEDIFRGNLVTRTNGYSLT